MSQNIIKITQSNEPIANKTIYNFYYINKQDIDDLREKVNKFYI